MSSHLLVPFSAAESAVRWLQGGGRDRGRDRGERDKRWRGVSAIGRGILKFALENTRKFDS